MKMLQYQNVIKNQFQQYFNVQFNTNKEIIVYYQQLDKDQKGQITWEIIGRQLNIDARAAYKYFITTFSKSALDKWPQHFKDFVLTNCEIYFKQLVNNHITEEQIRCQIINKINDQMNLKQMKQYHYESIYFSMRSKIHALFCQNLNKYYDKNQINNIKQNSHQNNLNNQKLSDLFSRILNTSQ
ncbi:Conserved_hypothetical protein [Hexamita inflata]|uniref:EF-hand domain-containing protein n=1 Tax=Hexamita inflata TaxID=28002 RepID=A0ABP1GGH9_9EUKA